MPNLQMLSLLNLDCLQLNFGEQAPIQFIMSRSGSFFEGGVA
eukprot:CAMPEP_0177279860 /NCGR_PEP_ID=MMETSP0367-20130122/70056_1 /TAXON_ID=447022 ORGANISM="Scrippsiella hangoei-like, Strain SHHI-4" /NCGR_SAMPLE_ID=MMETSP0367 /ASSEMBLY_ACC=CAM_ASM_000362 /LENGTH=41 /DNA_ID= /DNA_START= /DNA_END= /DNA_ORIENTATION=